MELAMVRGFDEMSKNEMMEVDGGLAEWAIALIAIGVATVGGAVIGHFTGKQKVETTIAQLEYEEMISRPTPTPTPTPAPTPTPTPTPEMY